MIALALDIPAATLDALNELADITDVGGPERLATLLTDALRTYEWVIHQQARGRIVVALEPPDIELLERSQGLNGSRESLAPFVSAGKLERAVEYFAERTGD